MGSGVLKRIASATNAQKGAIEQLADVVKHVDGRGLETRRLTVKGLELADAALKTQAQELAELRAAHDALRLRVLVLEKNTRPWYERWYAQIRGDA